MSPMIWHCLVTCLSTSKYTWWPLQMHFKCFWLKCLFLWFWNILSPSFSDCHQQERRSSKKYGDRFVCFMAGNPSSWNQQPFLGAYCLQIIYAWKSPIHLPPISWLCNIVSTFGELHSLFEYLYFCDTIFVLHDESFHYGNIWNWNSLINLQTQFCSHREKDLRPWKMKRVKVVNEFSMSNFKIILCIRHKTKT